MPGLCLPDPGKVRPIQAGLRSGTDVRRQAASGIPACQDHHRLSVAALFPFVAYVRRGNAVLTVSDGHTNTISSDSTHTTATPAPRRVRFPAAIRPAMGTVAH